MNTDILKGKWKEIKGQVRQKWGELTNDDVEQMQGSYEELSGALQKKYGYTKDQANRELDDFLRNNH